MDDDVADLARAESVLADAPAARGLPPCVTVGLAVTCSGVAGSCWCAFPLTVAVATVAVADDGGEQAAEVAEDVAAVAPADHVTLQRPQKVAFLPVPVGRAGGEKSQAGSYSIHTAI